MSKILVVSFCFPNEAGAEAIQTGRIVKYLSEKGIEVDVVTVSRNRIDGEKHIGDLFGFNERVRIFYTEDKPSFTNKYINKIISTFPFNQIFSDGCYWWEDIAFEKCEQLISCNHYDAIYTRAQPFTSNMIGLRTKMKYNVKWIAHFSDPWVDNPMRFNIKSVPSLNNMKEKRIFEKADFITVPSKNMDIYYKSKYSDYSSKVELLGHTWDLDALKYLSKKQSDNLVIAHIGSFYRHRNPNRFLKIIAHVKQNYYTDMQNHVKVQLVGNHDKRYIKLSNQLGVTDLVWSIKRVGYFESLDYMNNADILLLIDTEFKKTEDNIFMPSKLADYCMFNKPIICIGDKNSEVYDVVSNISGSLCIDNNETIESAAMRLYSFITEFNKENRKYAENEMDYFNGNTIIEKLTNLV